MLQKHRDKRKHPSGNKTSEAKKADDIERKKRDRRLNNSQKANDNEFETSEGKSLVEPAASRQSMRTDSSFDSIEKKIDESDDDTIATGRSKEAVSSKSLDELSVKKTSDDEHRDDQAHSHSASKSAESVTESVDHAGSTPLSEEAATQQRPSDVYRTSDNPPPARDDIGKPLNVDKASTHVESSSSMIATADVVNDNNDDDDASEYNYAF